MERPKETLTRLSDRMVSAFNLLVQKALNGASIVIRETREVKTGLSAMRDSVREVLDDPSVLFMDPETDEIEPDGNNITDDGLVLDGLDLDDGEKRISPKRIAVKSAQARRAEERLRKARLRQNRCIGERKDDRNQGISAYRRFRREMATKKFDF